MPLALPLTSGATEFQLFFNGLTLGDGTNYDVVKIEGIDTPPAVNQTDADRLRDWGQFMGAYYSTGREVTVDLEISAPPGASDATFRAAVEAFNAAMQTLPLTELPLAFSLPGMAQATRFVNARVLARDLVIDYPYMRHLATAKVQFWATDPRIYDSALQTATATLPVGNGGLSWPITWPASWGSSSGGGLILATNAGNFETRPVITVAGPVDNPTITNGTSGQALTFALTVASGDTLVVDLAAKTVLYFVGGTGLGGNRRGTMTPTSQWWALAPGTSTIQYTANTVDVGSTMTLAWRSAWL
jgi:hypothetical protein